MGMEEELEREYGEELTTKEENQLGKVEPVTKALTDMGSFWKDITTKFDEDHTCYFCKREIKKEEKTNIVKVPYSKVEKGLVAFVAICDGCNKEE
jgi:hypothetical protein